MGGVVIDTRTGPVRNSDGPGNQPLRQDRDASLVVTDSHARYAEAAVRGQLFTIASTGVTTLQGFASPLTSGGTQLLALYNPVNSGKAAIIVRGGAIPVSLGAIGGGPLNVGFAWNYQVNQSIVVAQTAAPTSNLLASTGPANSVMRGYGITALALSTTAVFIRPLTCVAQGTSTVNAPTFTAWTGLEETAGDLVVPPGSILCLVPTTTSTSASALAAIEYEEVPYP